MKKVALRTDVTHQTNGRQNFFGRLPIHIVKQTNLHHIILLIKIQGVLLLKMDMWRIEEASIGHLVCISCLFEVIGRTFVKKTSLHHVILLVKIQRVLLLKMDLWRIEEASNLCSKDLTKNYPQLHFAPKPIFRIGNLEKSSALYGCDALNLLLKMDL